jgi:hypothetical protein
MRSVRALEADLALRRRRREGARGVELALVARALLRQLLVDGGVLRLRREREPLTGQTGSPRTLDSSDAWPVGDDTPCVSGDPCAGLHTPASGSVARGLGCRACRLSTV